MVRQVGAGDTGGTPSMLRAWIMAARVPTLPAAVVPVLVGTAVAAAEGGARVSVFLAAMAVALLIQIGTNLANDYFDFVHGADTSERLGPTRVTQSGLIPAATVKLATIVVFGLAALIGLYLVSVGGWPFLVLGLLAIVAGVAYTGGPWPLGYHGLGDLAVFIFFGLVAVGGTIALHLGGLSLSQMVTAIPVGLLATAILVVNNLRDIDTDRAAGKRTLAVRLGRQGTRWEYLLLVAGAYLTPVMQWLAGAGPVWACLPWLSLPLAVGTVRAVWQREGRALNPLLRSTARLHLIFGVLLSIGWLLGRWLGGR